jgi:beta-N-acetylhexosaminidase
MTLSDTGLRFVVEPSSVSLTSEEREQLQELRPAGVMFRKRNFLQDAPYDEWLSEYARLLEDIRGAVRRPNLLIMIDHEGGRVHRFPQPITRFPYPAFYGSSEDSIRRVTEAMAVELKSLGVNVSCSPVADIHSNPKNPVINQRAYGRTAEEVCKRAVLCARTLLQNGIVPCGKHFPGHGDTGTDSHFALPVLHKSEVELHALELKPFEALVNEGVSLLMTAHILLPHLDKKYPATLSPAILRNLLREQMGYEGVVVADALGMNAIKNIVDSEEFSILATKAGVDLLLYVGDPVSIGDAIRCNKQLSVALERDEALLKSEMESEQRICALLESVSHYSVSQLPTEILEKHASLASSLSSHKEWEEFTFHVPGYD